MAAVNLFRCRCLALSQYVLTTLLVTQTLREIIGWLFNDKLNVKYNYEDIAYLRH
jgi:hypothetical protein